MIRDYEAQLKRSYAAVRAHASRFSSPPDQWRLADINLTLDPQSNLAVNFEFGGAAFYPESAIDIANRQVANFANAPPRLEPSFTLFVPEDSMCHRHAINLDAATGLEAMLRPALKAGKNRFPVPERYAPNLAVFGMGLGYHTRLLLKQFDICKLLVVESEPAVMAAGLAACDWSAVIAEAGRAGVEVVFLFHPDPVQCAFGVVNEMRAYPPSSLIGMRFFPHYEGLSMAPTMREFVKIAPLLNAPQGYFADELRQSIQARGNLAELPVLRRPMPRHPENTCAIVIGSGPSLDRSFDILSRLRERATLISCGTSLSALTAHGYRPDFHVEIETSPDSAPIIAKYASAEILAEIPVFCSAGTARSNWSQFKSACLFARAASASSMLFGDDVEVAAGAFPRVGNAGLAMALYLGFPNVVLLGMDTGYRPGGAHHADATVYDASHPGSGALSAAENSFLEGTEFLSEIEQRALRDPRSAATSVARGIGGGEILVDQLFAHAISSFVQLLAQAKDRTVYQIGDGALLDGAVNLTVEAFAQDLPVFAPAIGIDDLMMRADLARDLAASYQDRMSAVARAMPGLVRAANKTLSPPLQELIDFVRADRDVYRLFAARMAQGPETRRHATTIAIGMTSGTEMTFAKGVLERALLCDGKAAQLDYLSKGLAETRAMMDDMAGIIQRDFGGGR